MKYKFVDIGCSFFDTSVDDYGLDVNGLLVEPIPEHARVLPSSSTVKVECSAITEFNGTMEMNCIVNENAKYLSKQVLLDAYADDSEKSLRKREAYGNWWMNGGSSLLDTSEMSYEYADNFKPKTVNTITLKTLFEKYDVEEIDVLKIDVEGYERIVLLQLIDLLRSNEIKITGKIIAEYNSMSNLSDLDLVLNTICNEFGFRKIFVTEHWNEDVILEKL